MVRKVATAAAVEQLKKKMMRIVIGVQVIPGTVRLKKERGA